MSDVATCLVIPPSGPVQAFVCVLRVEHVLALACARVFHTVVSPSGVQCLHAIEISAFGFIMVLMLLI